MLGQYVGFSCNGSYSLPFHRLSLNYTWVVDITPSFEAKPLDEESQ